MRKSPCYDCRCKGDYETCNKPDRAPRPQRNDPEHYRAWGEVTTACGATEHQAPYLGTADPEQVTCEDCLRISNPEPTEQEMAEVRASIVDALRHA